MPLERALVLRRFRYGESSLVVHLFTRAAGRAHLLAKGAYRASSGYFGVLDLFDTLEVEWRARGGDLAPLSAARILVRRGNVSRDLVRYRAGLAVLELLDLVCPGPAEPAAFDLAAEALDRADDPSEPVAWIVPSYDLRLLGVLGLGPALRACAACGGPAPPIGAAADPRARVPFSAGAGGRLCLPCARDARASGRRVGTLPAAVLAVAHELATAGRPARPVEGALRGEVRDFVRRFLEYHLETRPRSRQAPRPGPGPGPGAARGRRPRSSRAPALGPSDLPPREP